MYMRTSCLIIVAIPPIIHIQKVATWFGIFGLKNKIPRRDKNMFGTEATK